VADRPGTTLRVVIADDHPYYRQGLAELLTRSGMDVMAQAANGVAAIQAVEENAPDVLVLDLNMPGLSGIEVIRRLAKRGSACRVLVLSVSAQEADVADAILAGASGYVLKDGPVDDVVSGIRAAAAGESVLSPRIASMLLRTIQVREEARFDARPTLSGRDVALLKLVAGGKSNHEIGEALSIEPSAVRRSISSLLAKLQADSRARGGLRTLRNNVA
jgi:DNA-binding NarL/FixJ family response regulator